MVPICNTTCGGTPGGGGPFGGACPPTGARVSTDTPQPLLNATDTQITFETEDFEVAPTEADAPLDRIVIGAPGIYQVAVEADYPAASDASTVTLTLRVNDAPTAVFMTPLSTTSPTHQNAQTFLQLNAGDVLTLFAEQVGNLEGILLLSAALTALRQACVEGPTTGPIG